MRKKFFLLIIVCLVMGAGVMAQTSTVSGTVFAEDNNEPIIGASVLVKGTTLGAVTDIEGKFTILNVPGTAKDSDCLFCRYAESRSCHKACYEGGAEIGFGTAG